VVARSRLLLVDALVRGDREVRLAAGGRELGEAEPRHRRQPSAPAGERGQLARVGRGAADVTTGEAREQSDHGETGPGQVVGVLPAHAVHGGRGVGDSALRQCVAGFDEYTGGIVRYRFVRRA
jgi:hypothetical protein